MSAPRSVTATFTNLTVVTVTTNPSGLGIIVDNTAIIAPQTFNWVIGTGHTIGAVTPQSAPGNNVYEFSMWSDGGPASHGDADKQKPKMAGVVRKKDRVANLLEAAVQFARRRLPGDDCPRRQRDVATSTAGTGHR